MGGVSFFRSSLSLSPSPSLSLPSLSLSPSPSPSLPPPLPLYPSDPNFVKKKVLKRLPAPPNIILPLLPYQEEGHGWMLEQEKEHGGGILADEMGMGKVRFAGFAM